VGEWRRGGGVCIEESVEVCVCAKVRQTEKGVLSAVKAGPCLLIRCPSLRQTRH
jgi:hypothetical protein